jgi:hypothetical protein
MKEYEYLIKEYELVFENLCDELGRNPTLDEMLENISGTLAGMER